MLAAESRLRDASNGIARVGTYYMTASGRLAGQARAGSSALWREAMRQHALARRCHTAVS